MAVESAELRMKIENLEGQKLVRRFTDELTGNTTLECAAIRTQEEDDAIANVRYEARIRGLFQDGRGK